MIPYALCFIENQNGKFLLQHRDDNPRILFPGHWGLFGGRVKAGETFKEGLIREVREELGIDISSKKIEFLFDNTFSDRIGVIFHIKMDMSLDEISLTEGQEAKFFSKNDILELKENVLPEIDIFRKEFINKI